MLSNPRAPRNLNLSLEQILGHKKQAQREEASHGLSTRAHLKGQKSCWQVVGILQKEYLHVTDLWRHCSFVDKEMQSKFGS